METVSKGEKVRIVQTILCRYNRVCLDEVRKQLEKMVLKKHNLPIEAVKTLASYKMDYLTETMNVVKQNIMPQNWRISRLVPNYKIN